MKTALWTHPRTNEQRVYVNGATSQYGVKVFVRDGSKNFTPDYAEVVVVSDSPMGRDQRDAIIDRVDEALDPRRGFKALVASL